MALYIVLHYLKETSKHLTSDSKHDSVSVLLTVACFVARTAAADYRNVCSVSGTIGIISVWWEGEHFWGKRCVTAVYQFLSLFCFYRSL